MKKEEEIKVVKNKKDHKVRYNIIGLLLLLAIISISYSTAVIVMGTDGIVPVIMVAPQALLVIVVLIWKFCKN